MATHITNRLKKACSTKKSKKPGKYFTLSRTLVYFPTHNAVPSKRVNITYEHTIPNEKLISFDPDVNGKLCITKSGSRAHIGLHSGGLKTMAKRMPHGAYVPIKWNNVSAAYKAKPGVIKSHHVFRFDSDLTGQLMRNVTSVSRSSTSTKRRKRKTLSKAGKNISRSLKAYHRGRKSALKSK